ncbi:unnamed protein product [Coccothraustes coccothraustes]
MAAGGSGGAGPGAGPGGGPGARRGSAGRDAEAEVWCRRVRELVSAVPANRLCFECGQRGVTYVDISVGSLVCTGCSGALRGLNPPHRVKSISMTTFSEAEVLFLQAHGNEACRRVWLGTFDPRTSLLPDSRDPQKVKEFLQEKYEKKRWYVAPDEVKEQVKEQVKPPQSTAAEPGPLQLLHRDTGTLPQVGPGPSGGCPRGAAPPDPAARPQPRPAARKASTDLLADIGGDPFASPAPAPAFAAFPAPSPGPAPARSAFPSFNAFGTSPGAPTFGGAVPPFHIPPSTTGTLRPPGTLGQGPGRGLVPPQIFGTPGIDGQEGLGSPYPCGVLGRGLGVPPPLHSSRGAGGEGFGYTNPFMAPVAPRPSTNPFESNSPGAAFTSPPVPGGFPSPFQADGLPFSGFSVAKASTNPFVTVPAPAAPFGIRHRATNPFL